MVNFGARQLHWIEPSNIGALWLS